MLKRRFMHSLLPANKLLVTGLIDKKRYTVETLLMNDNPVSHGCKLLKPLPTFNDLPRLDLEINASNDQIINNENLSFDKTAHACSFVNDIMKKLGLSSNIITKVEYKIPEDTGSQVISSVGVAMFMNNLSLKVRKSEYKNVDKIIAIAKAQTLKDAKTLVTIDFAERMYRCLDLTGIKIKGYVKKQLLQQKPAGSTAKANKAKTTTITTITTTTINQKKAKNNSNDNDNSNNSDGNNIGNKNDIKSEEIILDDIRENKEISLIFPLIFPQLAELDDNNNNKNDDNNHNKNDDNDIIIISSDSDNVKEQKVKKFKDDTEAANYVNHITNLYSLEPIQIKTERILYSLTCTGSKKSTSSTLFKFSNILKLPNNLLKPEFAHLKREISVHASNASLKKARKEARTMLAERLFECIDNGNENVDNNQVEEASPSSSKNILVDMSEETRNAMKSIINKVRESNTFEQERILMHSQTFLNIGNEKDFPDVMSDYSPSSFPSPNTVIMSNHDSFQRKGISSEYIQRLPVPNELNASLPIYQKYREIMTEIESHEVIIISAATGSGKTTQIPQYILSHYLNLKEYERNKKREWERERERERGNNGENNDSNNDTSLAPLAIINPPRVIVTQPRRIAAKSVAQRIAYEKREPLGSSVGYMVRFDSFPPRKMENGSILICTSGILLKKLTTDPLLHSYNYVILDEVHERDVSTDILLLTMKRLLRERKDLRLILMSATLQSEKLFQYYKRDGFKVSCCINLEGRNFPVRSFYLEDVVDIVRRYLNPSTISRETLKFIDSELSIKRGKEEEEEGEILPSVESMIPIARKRSLGSDSSFRLSEPRLPNLHHVGHGHGSGLANITTTTNNGNRSDNGRGSSPPSLNEELSFKSSTTIPNEYIIALIHYIMDQEPEGAILCFLPGLEEINAIHEGISSVPFISRKSQIHILHSSIPIKSTDEIFAPPPWGLTKIILSTNIAESSITIKDVVYVIDSGKQKIMNYDQKHRMNMLEMCWNSQANIKQRLGRAGRCQPGKYFLLMSRNRVSRLPTQTPPELLRLGLDDVCLGLRTNAPIDSKCEEILSSAIDPPPRQSIRNAIERLERIKAIDKDENLTTLGRVLADLPLSPVVGRMLVYGVIFKCLDPMLTIVSSIGERVWKPLQEARDKFDVHNLIRAIISREMEQKEQEIKQSQIQLSDHLIYEKLFSIYEKNPYDPIFDQYGHIISFSALKRVGEIKRQLKRTILDLFCYRNHRNYRDRSNDKSKMEDMEKLFNVNRDNSNLLRFIITAGFYPDLAIRKKKNNYQLKSLPRSKVKPSGSSAVHVPSAEALRKYTRNNHDMFNVPNYHNINNPNLYNLRQDGNNNDRNRDRHGDYNNDNDNDNDESYIEQIKNEKMANYLVYEELIDVGSRLISRNTAIDPLFLPLFGNRVISRGDHIVLDEWIKIYSTNKRTEDLRILSELRDILNDYMSLRIEHYAKKLTFNGEEMKLMDEFEDSLKYFIGETNIFRQGK